MMLMTDRSQRYNRQPRQQLQTAPSTATTTSAALTGGPPTTRSRSAVWRYYAVDAEAQQATCVFCRKALKYTPWEPSTSSLLKHLRFVHPDQAQDATGGARSQPDAVECISVESDETPRTYSRGSSESSSMDPKKQIQRLLQDSILNLCKASLDAGCQFEVDGIICITSPKDEQQIVIKMHEFIETMSDPPSSKTSHSNGRSGRNNPPASFTAAPSSRRGHDALFQVLSSPAAQDVTVTDDGDLNKKQKKVKVFEIVDEPVDSQPLDDEGLLWGSSADMDEDPLEIITVPDGNIPQEVALAVSKVMGSGTKRPMVSPQGVVKKARVTVAHPNKHSPITGPGPYICHGCERQFGTRTSLSLHVVKKHSSYAMVYCGACQTGFVDRASFSAHECMQSHPSSEVVDPANDFTDQGGKLDVHSKSNTMLKSLLTAERMGGRLRHADSVASRQPYVIDETDALLDEPPPLSPESISSADKSVEAEVSRPNSACPSDEQDHTCSVCSKVFESFRQLESHCWKVHRRYPCNHCYKTFTERYTRERHYRIHTGVKPFQCGACNRGFTRRDHLRTHCDNTHSYPNHLFDLNYKGGEFYPPTDGADPDAEALTPLSADNIDLRDSPVAQIVDEFIPLDEVEEEEEPSYTTQSVEAHGSIPVFPGPTEVDHQAEWEEETSSAVPALETADTELAEEGEGLVQVDTETMKLEPTDPDTDLL